MAQQQRLIRRRSRWSELIGTQRQQKLRARFSLRLQVFQQQAAQSFPDALAGGPVAGSAGQPLLLVPPTGTLPEPTVAYLQTRNGMVTSATVFGGLSAVGADVVTQVVATIDGNAVAV